MKGTSASSSNQRKITALGRFSYSGIPMITQFIEEAARDARLDEDAVYHCQMAVDEACTNVIEHGYAEDPTGNIEVSCWIEPHKLTIQIVDQGKKFDPTLAPPPKFSDKLDEIRPGGVGIHLIKKLMDEVQFEFTERGNTLTLVKTSAPPVVEKAENDIPSREARTGVWLIEPNGQIDSLTAPSLDQAIADLIAQGHHRIVVDFRSITYISSKGIKALVAGWRQARSAGGDLALSGLSPKVQGVIETIGLGQLFAIYSTSDEAVEDLGAAM